MQGAEIRDGDVVILRQQQLLPHFVAPRCGLPKLRLEFGADEVSSRGMLI
jgi:hypothetical protein